MTTAKPIGIANRCVVELLESHLRTAIGMRFVLVERVIRGRSPWGLSLAWLSLYLTMLALVFAISRTSLDSTSAPLIALLVWTGVHFAAQLWLARTMTCRILTVARLDILPNASPKFCEAVAKALVPSGFFQLGLGSYFIIALVGFASFAAIWIDLELSKSTWPKLLPVVFWVGATLYIYFACMRCIVTSRFIRAFSYAATSDESLLFPLCASQSPLIAGLAILNRSILVYWIWSFLLLATVVCLLLLPCGFALPIDSAFVRIIVPAGAFVALGMGSSIYVGSENRIADELRRFSLGQAGVLQQRIHDLIQRRRTAEEGTALAQLIELQDRTIAGGCYGNRLGKLTSIALPLLPAISLLERLVGDGKPS